MAQACDENQRCVIPRSVISIQRRHTRAAVGKLVSPCCLSSVTMIQGSAKLSPKESENSSRFSTINVRAPPLGSSVRGSAFIASRQSGGSVLDVSCSVGLTHI